MTVRDDTGTTVAVPRWVVGAVVVILVAGVAVFARSGVSPSRELPVTVAPPDAAPVEEPSPLVSACPRDKPVVVVGGLAYPPGFPSPPVGPPDGCFATVAAASESGHRVPAPPDYVEVLHGLYLVPISNAWFRDCLSVARDAGFEIPCLGRRPTDGVLSVCAGTCVTGGGYVWALRGMPAPPGWCRDCLPDVVVSAAPRDAPKVVQALARCGPGNGGHPPWRLFFCDQQAGPANTQVHAGNTMRRGRHGDIVFAVSVGGRGPRQRQLVNRLFDSLVFVGS